MHAQLIRAPGTEMAPFWERSIKRGIWREMAQVVIASHVAYVHVRSAVERLGLAPKTFLTMVGT